MAMDCLPEDWAHIMEYQGENLFTVTGYSGMDPEVSGDTDYMSYPTPISVTFGVNVSF